MNIFRKIKFFFRGLFKKKDKSTKSVDNQDKVSGEDTVYGLALNGRALDLSQRPIDFTKFTRSIRFSSYREIETFVDFDTDITGVIYDMPDVSVIPNSDPWTSEFISTYEIIGNRIKFKSKYERGIGRDWEGDINIDITILYYSKFENYNYGLEINNSKVAQPIILSELKVATVDNGRSLRTGNPIVLVDTEGKYVRISNPYEVTANEFVTIRYREMLKQHEAGGYGVNVYNDNRNILSIESNRFRADNILNQFYLRFRQNRYYKGDNDFWFIGRLPNHRERIDDLYAMYYGEDYVMCKIAGNELEIRVWSNYRAEYGGANYVGWSAQDVDFHNLIYVNKLIPI